MAPGSGPAPSEENVDIMPTPVGWKRLDFAGEPASIFTIDSERPDYPEKWRSRSETRERHTLSKDSGTQAAIQRLQADWATLDFERIVEAQVRGAEIREHTGHDKIIHMAGMLRDGFYYKIRQAAEETAPAAGVSYTTAIRYIAEQTLPVEFVLYVAEETPQPISITVNADPRRRLVMGLSPGEVSLRFQAIARRDLNYVGRFITEALEITDPSQRRNRGGRPSISDEEGPTTTPELVARLSHWEGWSHRRIAAFLGWLGDDDDWNDSKVRARIEQRVRRWVRLGEGALRIGVDNDDDDHNAWKQRPDQLARAVRADEKRHERRR
jgi:hypothetical protein